MQWPQKEAPNLSYQSSEATETQVIPWSFLSLSTAEGNDTLP